VKPLKKHYWVANVASISSYRKRFELLKSERSTFIPLYRELSDYILAHRGRFLVSDKNKGHKRNTKQINSAARLAARTLASGMMSGVTSPARPWFMLSTGDADLDEKVDIKEWLHSVQKVMYKVFGQSNLYNSLHTLYSELGVFGTATMAVNQDFENVIHCKVFTAGSYCIATNGKGEVDTFYREYEMTVAQVVGEFGMENCSNNVKRLWDSGHSEAGINVVHGVELNDDRDNNSPLATGRKFRSFYFENGDSLSTKAHTIDANDKFLAQSGFNDFPVLAPRWDVTAEDVYATDCPAMTCLGDVKSLQLAEKRKYQAIDKMVSPPLMGQSNLRNKVGSNTLRANEIIWVDDVANGLTSIYGTSYRPDINLIKEEINGVEMRISRSMYEDLFLMLANSDRKQITAREVAEKHEEKLLMLGPVLERLHNELLDPLINRTFNILQENGVLPEPPEELQNKELKVEYVSVLAQAQRLVATGGIERLAEFAGSLAQVWPEARHKVDATQMVDDFSNALGVNPKQVRSDDAVAEIIAQEQQAAAAAQQQEQAMEMAKMAKPMAETDVKGQSILDRAADSAGLT
jgi:hypothetical protein